MPSFHFHKGERLKSRKAIEQLFRDRSMPSLGQYPLRLIWDKAAEERSPFPVQISVSVPKRRFKSAVARNRLRRQVREAWRLQKQGLYEVLADDNHQYVWMVLYTGQEALPYSVIEKAMQKLIRKFIASLQTPPNIHQ